MFSKWIKQSKDTGSEKSNKELLVLDNVELGENIEHEGDLEIKGNVGEGSVISVKNGNITVHGNVENNAELTAKTKSSSNSFMSVTIIKNGVQTTNISGDTKSAGDISIHGKAGDSVCLEASMNIKMKDAGDCLTASAGHSFTANDTGEKTRVEAGFNVDVRNCGSGAEIEAGHNIKGNNMAAESELEAGFDIKINDLGNGSNLESGHGLSANNVEESCTLESGFNMSVTKLGTSSNAEAGHNFEAELIGEECSVEAGFSIKASVAFNSASLETSFEPKIGEYVDTVEESQTKGSHSANNFDIM